MNNYEQIYDVCGHLTYAVFKLFDLYQNMDFQQKRHSKRVLFSCKSFSTSQILLFILYIKYV